MGDEIYAACGTHQSLKYKTNFGCKTRGKQLGNSGHRYQNVRVWNRINGVAVTLVNRLQTYELPKICNSS
jgi:hypothetical protein